MKERSNIYNENLILESIERLENIIEATNIGTWEWDIKTGKLIVNEKYAEILGYELKDFVDFDIDTWNKYVENSCKEKSKLLLEEHFQGKTEFYNSEVSIRHKSGKILWVINRGKVIKWNPDGSPSIMFGTIYDDTHRKENEEERLKLTMAIEQATMTILMTDTNGIIEYVNPAFEKNTGYSLEEAIGMDTKFLEKELNPKHVYEDLTSTIISGQAWEGELINRRKDGRIYYEEARVIPVVDSEGKIISFVSMKEDVTEKRELQRKLREASIRDSLTNIYNRRYVFDRLEQFSNIYKRNGNVFSIAILDIDYFKKVNDTYGHPGGDFILQEFSRILEESIRSTDILGRYGGEEFIIIFIDSNREYSKIIVDRIREKVRNTIFKYNGNEIQFTFSAGISDASESDIKDFTFEYLINESDKRLYKAKDTGRNKVIIE